MNGESARRIVETLTVAVVILNQRLQITFMNPAAEMLFALSVRQVQGMAFAALAMGAEAALAGMRRCLTRGRPYTERELSLTLAEGNTLTVDCTVSPLWEWDTPTELLVELRPLDRQLRLHREEHVLAQHQISRTLLRNLAHEVKNPLGGLRGAAQLLERELHDEGLKEYTRIIIGEADRLTQLVDRMLSPTQSPVRRPINIHELLERVRSLTLAETPSGIRIERDYDPSIPTLSGDPDHLIQALLNIVRNACQALTDSDQTDGKIILRTRVLRQHSIGHKRHKLVVRIDILDNGPGIAKERLEEVFYPLISGRPGGSGLGLAIAQSLVNQHGGLIECQSQPGETVFTVTLPLETTDGEKGMRMGH